MSAKASLCCVYLGLTQKGTRVIYCYFIGYKLLYFHNFDFLWQPCFISHQTIYFLPDTSDVQQKNSKSLTVRTFSKMFRKLQTTSKSLIILPETRKRVKLGVNGDICWVQAAVSRGQCGITSPNVTLFFCAHSFFLSLLQSAAADSCFAT